MPVSTSTDAAPRTTLSGHPRHPGRGLVTLATGVVAALVAGLLTGLSAGPAATAEATPVKGADVSWPQCPEGTGIPGRPGYGLPMPGAKAEFVVIGLTNGPAYTPNPCLAEQVAWAKARGLWTSGYAVATYPTKRQRLKYRASGPFRTDTRLGRLRNAGYAQGMYNVRRANRAGLPTPHIWIDVETYPFRPWAKARWRNRAVVRGILQAYKVQGRSTGFYSVRSMWPTILGQPGFHGYPEWHTAGPRTRSVALQRCTEPTFQGGPIVLAQWWTDTRDHDITCPAYSTPADLQRYFHDF